MENLNFFCIFSCPFFSLRLDMKHLKKNIFYLIVLITWSPSCKSPTVENINSSTNAETVSKAIPPLAPGFSDPIACVQDPSISYALYLPAVSDQKKTLPVIFIFDAHARGHLPVELYKELAETFGFILIASNDSRNGQDPALSNKIFQALLFDAGNRLPIDNHRIYTMGFSGGSRVASSIAQSLGGIAGVIGCSAGFANKELPATNAFNYIGIVGNEDFNLTEMKGLENSLNQTGIRHQLLVFNGKHDWCPAETMREAFYWITFNAMRDQLIPSNDSLIKAYLSIQEQTKAQLKKSNNEYELFLLNQKIVNYLDGLYDIASYKSSFNQLQQSDRVLAYESYLNRISGEESRLQKQYAEFMTSRDLPWWQAEVARLKQAIQNDTKKEEALFKKRLLSYMSLAAYMYSSKSIETNQLDRAARFLKIYALVDPPNSEHAYLTAVLMMKYNNPGPALTALQEALNLGFSDRNRMQSEPGFSSLQTDSTFQRILAGLIE